MKNEYTINVNNIAVEILPVKYEPKPKMSERVRIKEIESNFKYELEKFIIKQVNKYEKALNTNNQTQ